MIQTADVIIQREGADFEVKMTKSVLEIGGISKWSSLERYANLGPLSGKSNS